MQDRGNEVNHLNRMRKKARLSYFYLGIGLLLVLAADLWLGIMYYIGVGAAVLFLYMTLLRRDARQYRASYREIVTLSGMDRHIKTGSFVHKNIMTLEQVRREGCVPIKDIRGIVRAGVEGSYRGQEVCMSDISYTYQIIGKNGWRQVMPLSG